VQVPLTTARSGHMQSEEWQYVKTVSIKGARTNTTWYFKVYDRKVYKVSCGIYYTLSRNQKMYDFARRTGTDIWRVPYVLWELTRLSFVIDWFATMGTWLQTIFPNTETKVLDGWTTIICKSQRKFVYSHAKGTSPYLPSKTYVYCPDYTTEQVSVTRRKGAPENPGFPMVKVKLTWKRVLDAWALFVKK